MEWRPQPKQEEFLRRTEDEVLFGGAKGPGKTEALLMGALYQKDNPKYKAIIFRRTYPELLEIEDRSRVYLTPLGATFNSFNHRWTFPSGATLQFGSVPNKGDEYRYQGREFHYMGFDQLEEFTEDQYLFLVAQNRTSDPSIKTYVRATANPGGVGHLWVRKRFIEDKEPGKTYEQVYELPYPIRGQKQIRRTSIFIPATVYDNPKLLEANPGYLTNLLQLSENRRKALLEGNWDVFQGQYFSEWSRGVHVVEPFPIPGGWRRYRAVDHGSFAPTACLWFAIDYDGIVYAYREYYKVLKLASNHATLIDKVTGDEVIRVTYADPSMWIKNATDGKSVEEFYQSCGVTLTKANHDRLNGWAAVREYLAHGPGRPPRLRIFKTCYNLIRTLPELIHDDKSPEDINSESDDHLADALRYFLVSRSHPSRRQEAKPAPNSFAGIMKVQKIKKEQQQYV